MASTRQDPISTLSALASGAWTLAWLCLAIKWRLAPVAWPHAWPGPGMGLLGWPTLALLALAAGSAGSLGWATRGRPGLLAALLIWPTAPLVLAWLVVPLAGRPHAWTGAPALAVLALALWLWRRIARIPGRQVDRPGPGWSGGRRWRWVHGLLLAFGVAGGLALGGFRDSTAVGLSLVLYPCYAAMQMALLLALPWPWLLAAGGDRWPVAAAAAATLFGLIHWPNVLLMALTAAGMLFWASEYQRGRPLAALAVSMGLLATLVAQGLPDAVTNQMRVGPAVVHADAVPAVVSSTLAGLTSTPADSLSARFVAALYPAVVGREAADTELARWDRVIAHEQRCFVAYEFISSDEYRRRHPDDPPPAMDGSRYWTELPPPWPARIREQASRDNTGTWEVYVIGCYRALLGRTPGADEAAAWQESLAPGQWAGVLAAMIANRRQLARAPFDTLSSDDLRFWR